MSDSTSPPGRDPSGPGDDSSRPGDDSSRPGRDYIVSQTVFIHGENVPFGELTLENARARADELRSAAGWGPTARVAPIARAWRELTMTMERSGAASVGELPDEVIVELAPRLWVVPPGGSLL